MRRFEFVDGSSAKFWMAEAAGNKFVVVYGRLGTDGQRKEKDFPNEAAAQKEYEKKVAEKLREGYHEVAANAAAAAPAGAKGAAAASAKLEIPPRFVAGEPTAAQVEAARAALASLEGSLGGRSWHVARASKRARYALRGLHGTDPAKLAPVAKVFEGLLATVTAGKGERRLPLRVAMELLAELDVAVFERALSQWGKAPASAPAAAAVKVLAQQVDKLGEPELALRVGVLLCDRPEARGSNDAGWKRRWSKVRPHLDGFLIGRGSTVPKYVAALDAQGDRWVERRIAALRA